VYREFLKLASIKRWVRGVLLVSAHPEDETIGAGGVMPRLPRLSIAQVTGGAPADRRWWGDPSLTSRERYARLRHAELARALALAGVGIGQVRPLGREDQQTAFDLAALAGDLARVIDLVRPGVVLTHPYEGGHPDHDAAAFAAHAARGLVKGAPPVVVEFTSYHAAGDGIATGQFLPAPPGAAARGGDASAEVRISLAPSDQARKARMFACFRSQAQTLEQLRPAPVERFRLAPEYDFTAPPHAGTLHYERFDWGITGEEWRALAARALVGLAPGAARC
jgi:LmbE family N-acetylglucosaminyl deacetylase